MNPRERKLLFESVEFEQEYTYEKSDLGAVYSESSTCFKVWAPTAKQVFLKLYKSGDSNHQDLISKEQMFLTNQGVWELNKLGDYDGIYYTYYLIQEDEEVETIDPYAKACGANGIRGMVVDLKKTNPKGFDQDATFVRQSKTPIIYELHIKDFSYDKNADFPEEVRGKYLAFEKEQVTLCKESSFPVGIQYLKELGITHVHLLPAFDFASIDETGGSDQFNWGYDPCNFNIPEGSYATDVQDGHVRIREFKQMVMALHRAGLGVIMDVVYNHTYDTDSCFQKTVPYYYYRQHEDGSFSNGSGCGNETASERVMFRKYMLDSIMYWAKEYHIDGFRFDLMGLHDIQTMNEIRDRLDSISRDILMYGEPWTAGESPMGKEALPAVKANVHLLHPRISIFLDNTRDVIKGSVFDGKEPGFINGNGKLIHEIPHVLNAWCDGGGDFSPRKESQIISYVSAHDNYTLFDKLLISTMKYPDFLGTNKETLSLNRLSAVLIFTAKGIPFFQAGEEFARTKEGEENSYNLSPSLNQLDWKRTKKYKCLVDYYKGLIQIRQNLIGEHQHEIKILKAKRGILVYEISTKDHERLLIVMNVNKGKRLVKLPKGSWKIAGKEECILYPQMYGTVKKKVKVEGKSSWLLLR